MHILHVVLSSQTCKNSKSLCRFEVDISTDKINSRVITSNTLRVTASLETKLSSSRSCSCKLCPGDWSAFDSRTALSLDCALGAGLNHPRGETKANYGQ